MKFIIYLLNLFIILLLNTAQANTTIPDGTYIGSNSNILNFGTGENSETNRLEYNLFIFSSEIHNGSYFTALPTNANGLDYKLFFSSPPDPYDNITPSPCQITASLLENNRILIKTEESCSKAEQSFDGEYIFSAESTFIPQKYWGEWGECGIEPAHIAKADVSADGYYHHMVLGYELQNNTLIVDGFNLDERQVRRGNISFHFLPNDKVTINTYWDSKFSNLKKCKKEIISNYRSLKETSNSSYHPIGNHKNHYYSSKNVNYKFNGFSHTQWNYVRGYYRKNGTYVRPHQRRTR